MDSLASGISASPGLAAFAAEAEADDDGEWAGGVFQAKELGREDLASQVITCLLSHKTTSGESGSPYFQALGAAAARLFGAKDPPLHDRATALLEMHGDLLASIILGQRDLTETLLDGVPSVVLHRGDAVDGLGSATTADPMLWPLASFAVDFATARSFAISKAERTGCTPLVYSAHVPAGRIAVTPASGMAAALENEVVVGAGEPGDLATVTIA